jgi:signal peptidase I
MIKIIKKALTVLGWTVLAGILVIVAFVMIMSRRGWQFDAVLSGSMEPVYHVGGLSVFRPVDPSTVKVGDIISFKLPKINTPICHRVIDIVHEGDSIYFQTKGDANEDPDQDKVLPSYVKGTGILHIPYVGHLIDLSRLGRQRIYVLGKGFPAATLVIGGMGLLFIGLTMKDTLEEVVWPGRKLRKDRLKKQREFILKRRRAWRG